MNKYKHFTREQRYQLEVLLRQKTPKSKIAKQLKVDRTTVYREIKRNTLKNRKYNAQIALEESNERKQRFKTNRKLTSGMIKFILQKLEKEQWSPEQISQYCKTNKIEMVSHEWIYQFVYADKKQGGTLYKHLRIASKPYRKRYGSYDRRGKIKDRISIEQRPEVVEERSRIGDWEVDTLIGKNHRGALLSIVERKSLFVLIQKLSGKFAGETRKSVINALAPFKKAVYTITSDNGSEFAEHKRISKKLETDYFFTHPYSAWERGTNENMNGLIRQYVPKNSALLEVPDGYLQIVALKLNTRPRKSLNWKTPLQIFINNFNTQSVALGT